MKREHRKIAEQLIALERELAKSPSLNGSQDGASLGPYQFISGTLSALGNIRREEADRDRPFGYKTTSLEGMHSNVLAQHLAALTVAEHPDADYASDLLLDRGEHDLLAKAYGVVGWLERRSSRDPGEAS